jgi:PAS domain S-box-containing protein
MASGQSMSLVERLFTEEVDADQIRHALVEHSEQVGGLGSWAWDLASGRHVWSDNMFRLLGLEPGEVEPSAGLLMEMVHPEDRAALDRTHALIEGERPLPGRVYRFVTPGGEIRHIHAALTLTTDSEDGRRTVVGLVRDVTAERQADREIAAHVAVTRVLSEWEDLDRSGQRLLCELAAALGFARAVLWIPVGQELMGRLVWQVDGEDAAGDVSERRIPANTGLAGLAWRTNQPVSLQRADQETGYLFRAEAARAGLRGAIAIPLVGGADVLGVIGLAGPHEFVLDDRMAATLTGIGHEVGAFLAHRVGEIRPGVLSPREVQVLRLAAEGLSGPQIATRLHVSPATVKRHFEHIYEKYEVEGRSAAVAKAIREGLIA